uniref:Uncharacterized protein n=1 Tax=Quercus lobata TaxID=97700 RepID=A0A7N2LJN4_QUELO
MKRKKEEKKREEMKRKKEGKKRKKEKYQDGSGGGKKKKERQNEELVKEERKKQGYFVPALVLTSNTLGPAIGVENITSLTRKRVVVHVRHHVDDVLRHDHAGDVLCHHDEHAGDVLRRDEYDEHVVDVLLLHADALLLHEDHDHDRRDAHRHHDNALLFRHVHRDVLRHNQVHVHVLHDVPHRGVEYDDDFRGETFSKVLLKSKLRIILEVSLVRMLLRVYLYL